MHKTTAPQQEAQNLQGKAQNLNIKTCEAQKPAQTNLRGNAQNLQGKAKNLHLETCEAQKPAQTNLHGNAQHLHHS